MSDQLWIPADARPKPQHREPGHTDRPVIPGWDRQTLPAEGAPHGWVQWNGTDLCMDIHCSCGCLSHVDGTFIYYVKCPECGQIYMCNGHIELVPLTPEEAADPDLQMAEGSTD